MLWWFKNLNFRRLFSSNLKCLNNLNNKNFNSFNSFDHELDESIISKSKNSMIFDLYFWMINVWNMIFRIAYNTASTMVTYQIDIQPIKHRNSCNTRYLFIINLPPSFSLCKIGFKIAVKNTIRFLVSPPSVDGPLESPSSVCMSVRPYVRYALSRRPFVTFSWNLAVR